MDAVGGRHHEPAGRAGELDFLIPTPTLEKLVLAARRPDWVRERRCRIGLEPIGAPFPNVAVHVVYSPRIWTLQPNGMRRGFAVLRSPGELISDAGVVAKTEQIGGSCPTRVFPLGFGRKTVFITGRQASRLTLTLGQGRAIAVGVEKSDFFHRPIRIPCEVARIPSQDCREFAWGNLILSDPEVASNRDGKSDSHESAGLDVRHIGQRNHGGWRRRAR